MKGFRVEQGDVLLSVQMILTREEEAGRRSMRAGARPAPVPAPRPVERPTPTAPRAPVPALRPTRPAPSPMPAARPVRARNRPAGSPVMVDPLTGIGTIHALRRDLMLEQAWPVASRATPSLVALEIAPLDRIRVEMGAEAGDHVLKSLVEAAPFALRTQDRVYRSGRNQLTLLLPGTDGADVERARSTLEAALHRRLAGRGYPEVRLAARKLDAVALAS